MSLFVDTSAWYGSADTTDEYNGRAKEILSSGEDLVTTDHVLVETWFLVQSRIGFSAAERFWNGLQSGLAHLEPVNAADIERARSIRATFQDQRFSIVDRTSFVVMERLGLDRVASFDHHFTIYRYGPRLDRAFTVVR